LGFKKVWVRVVRLVEETILALAERDSWGRYWRVVADEDEEEWR
jgi:hypothetical protein